jgi:hypothetical protein
VRRREAAARRLAKASESVRGSLIERFLPCGKAGCRCKSGDLHGPAYYLTVSYPGGKTRQVYVGRAIKDAVERWLANYREVQAALEEISAINLELIRLKAVSKKT